MKTIFTHLRLTVLTLLGLVLPLSLWAQAPPADLDGAALKDWLVQNYYQGKHKTLGYSSARQKMYNYIDNKSNTITGVYSGLQVSWTYGGSGTNPQPLNCEHTVPQSFFGKGEPMKSDIHHLFPTYSNWNSTRSNHPFAEIDDQSTAKWMYLSESKTSVPTSNIDLYSEYASSKFEPREDHKGNCARAIFYFYTMYPSQAGSISRVGNLDMLYQWHLNDPVDEAERNRNDGVEAHQGNRNPYIDYPECVARAWGFTVPDQTVPSAPFLKLSSTTSVIEIAWTDLYNETSYTLYKSTDGINYHQLTSLSANAIWYQDAAVSEGTVYYYYAVATNAEGNSVNSNVVSGQLGNDSGSGDGTASDLLISEYVEGSSYNKVIEIANYTGKAIDLSAYSLMKQSNGAGAWGSELQLSGSLAHAEVYVIAHSSASSDLDSEVDLSTSSGALSFNGNDPVGLFKSGALIDVVGQFNNTASFGANKTMVRITSVAAPSVTYDVNEWDERSVDDFTNLGKHVIDGGGAVSDTEAPSVPANLVASNVEETSFTLVWEAATDNVGVAEYKVYLDGGLYQTVSVTTADISGLDAGRSYNMSVSAVDAANNASVASDVLRVTTKYTGGDTGSADELYISEYVEGSSFNKAIEIANFTGNAVDLSAYSLMKQVNGAGNWGSELKLSGSLAHGCVYVIAHSSASTDITSVADLTTSSGALSFNGDDPVSLHKDGNLIDVVGLFNSTASFAKDVTLVRKKEVTAPSTTYDANDWDSYLQDDFSHLKAHVTDISTALDELGREALQVLVFPVPASEYVTVQLIHQKAIGNVHVELLNVNGQLVVSRDFSAGGTSFKGELPLYDVAKGIYLLTIRTPHFSTSQKLVVK